MFTIYHIPKRKEWGCTKNLNRRLRELNYKIEDVDRIITCGNIDMASNMERDLNIEYGYGWNNGKDYRNIIKNRKSGGNGALSRIPLDERINRAKLSGKKTHLSGKLDIARKKSAEVKSIPIDVYDYKTGKYIATFGTILECTKKLKCCNIHAVLYGHRLSDKGYTFKYK